MTSRLSFLAVVLLVLSASAANGQLAASQSSSILKNQFLAVNGQISKSFGIPDYMPTMSPRNLNSESAPGNPFLTGSISSKAFNNGKFGRLYCWDAQGNLRSSFLFVDISGKRKRGLKLVFPKHRLIFDNRNKVAF